MHFRSFGTKRRKPLLILHGWGLSSEYYETLASQLSERFYVLVPDFPGFGETPAPQKPYAVDDYVKAVKRFLKEQNIQQVAIIGHSFGGRVALKLADQSPAIVSHLILTGVPGVERFRFKRTLKRAIYWTGSKVLKGFGWLPPVRKLKERFYRHRDYHKVSGVMQQTFLKVVKERLTKVARRITQPTLLLWGARDQMAPVDDAEKMLSIIPDSYLKIFTRVGHKLPYEKPHEFAHEVVTFLKK